jgi:eukaryotic-like serine/threonine-protein kinase
MSKREDRDITGSTKSLVFETSVNVESRLRQARLHKRLFGGELQPVKIDRFTLLERIGSGSMGEIYAAYDERLDRKVAIKLVRADTAVPSRAQKRLLREARALAKVSHPNVVPVYEAGTFEGRVFIAMEFVRGTTLRRWLEEHVAKLTGWERVAAVLKQFLAIGRGLAAAHAAGVIHRDFKPDNVLVGEDGRPRVVDFGLARAVLGFDREEVTKLALSDTQPSSREGKPEPVAAPPLKSSMMCTTEGRILGTPRYMPPEQMHGGATDCRSDQFSFCVALYNALYGEWPYPGKSLPEIMLALDSGEIVQPSRGAMVPAAVRKALLRGLAREPADRFPSMEALLDALEVERTHRLQRLLSMSVPAVALAAGLIAYGTNLRAQDRCAGVGDPMDALWDEQQREALASAFAGTGMLYAGATWRSTASRIDAYAEQWTQSRRSACEATRVHHEQSPALLDKRMLCLDRGRRRLEALLDALGDIDARTLQHAAQAAAELPEVALCDNLDALASDVAPPGAHIAAGVDETRDRLAEAHTLTLLGDYREALEIAREALARAESLGYEPVHADALYTVGWVLVHHGTPADAREGEALMMHASNLAEGARHDELVASIWNHLSLSSYQNHATTEPGYAWAQRALAAVRSIGEPAHQQAQVLRHLGLLHYKDHQLAAAEKYQRQALDRLPAGTSPLVHAPYLLSLASTVRALGRHDEALALYRQAEGELLVEVGEDHPTVADVRFELATFHADRGVFDRAAELMTAARRVYELTLGTDHPRVGMAYLELAGIERDRGMLGLAYEHALRAEAIYEAAYAPDDFTHARVHEHLGALAFRQGRYGEAVTFYRRALDIQSKHLAPDAHDIGLTHANLAEAYVRLGRHDEALTAVTSASDILSDYPDPTVQAFLDSQRGQALLGKGRHAQAVTALERAVAHFGDGASRPAESADAFWALARAVDRRGDSDRARALARRARELYATQGESSSATRAVIERWLRHRS